MSNSLHASAPGSFSVTDRLPSVDKIRPEHYHKHERIMYLPVRAARYVGRLFAGGAGLSRINKEWMVLPRIYASLTDLIGGTPLLELRSYAEKHSLKSRLLAKMEYLNPAHSVKDRIAKAMIEDAEKRGLLKEGSVIIEPTSGNTGISLASVAAARGYRVIITTPDTMSMERRSLLTAYGVELVLTEGSKGMKGSMAKAAELTAKMPGAFSPCQFMNPANPAVHRATTGPEIWNDTDGQVDIFVCGAGTGGTITGVGEYLKSRNPKIQIVAVEPAGSPVLSKGVPGPHDIPGLGPGFIPEVLNRDILDEVIAVEDEDAYRAERELARTEGFLAGVSSGAVLWAAAKVAKRPQNSGKMIVLIMADTGGRYISSPLFQENL